MSGDREGAGSRSPIFFGYDPASPGGDSCAAAMMRNGRIVAIATTPEEIERMLAWCERRAAFELERYARVAGVGAPPPGGPVGAA